MAELTPQERLQPFLLDRLVDEEPHNSQESREKRVISMKQFRRAIFRDLSFLLNSRCSFRDDELDATPQVKKTVLNYGIPDISGLTLSNLSPAMIEKAVRNALLLFEPRIMPNTLSVHFGEQAEHAGLNSVGLEIKAEVWSLPLPESLYVKTEVDLETGAFELRDQLNG